ncbi:MAG: hypothetical protein RSA84_17765 [Acinetobacter sp.]
MIVFNTTTNGLEIDNNIEPSFGGSTLDKAAEFSQISNLSAISDEDTLKIASDLFMADPRVDLMMAMIIVNASDTEKSAPNKERFLFVLSNIINQAKFVSSKILEDKNDMANIHVHLTELSNVLGAFRLITKAISGEVDKELVHQIPSNPTIQ